MTAQAYDLLMQRDDFRDLYTRKDNDHREKSVEHRSLYRLNGRGNTITCGGMITLLWHNNVFGSGFRETRIKMYRNILQHSSRGMPGLPVARTSGNGV
ncbi:MAG TPA: hypothetical protein VGJ92_01550 [Methanocella sp.]